MNTKLFNIIGISRFQGVLTFRVSNGSIKHRETVLAREGHTDVQFKTLPQPMTKADAVAWMRNQGVDAVVPAKNLRKKIETILAAERAAQEAAERQAAPVDKLAAKRARDAARKREKRAAERAAREAAKQAGVNQLMEAVDQEFGVDVERELAGE
jgi:predicted transcriptional regulator